MAPDVVGVGVAPALVVRRQHVRPERPDQPHQAFGGHGSYVEDVKDLRSALDEAMRFDGPALVNVKLSQGSERKPQEFKWHS